MPRSKFSSIFLPSIILGGIVFIAYSAYLKTSQHNQLNEGISVEIGPQLPAELLSCNDVKSAELTEAFSTCLSFAEENFIDAQRKIAWSYTREGEFQDWQEAFNWLNKIAQQDADIELLSQIVLFLLGESDQDKINAEADIRQLADIRFPPAEAYLATLYFLELNLLPRDANPAWLLRKAYDHDKSMISPFEMAAVYANGFGTRRNIQKAKQILIDYAKQDFPFTANNVAWFLATLDNNPITNTEFVVTLAESAVSDPEYGNRYSFVDTLAASYAAEGNFEKAVNTQQQAIDLMTQIEPEGDEPIEDIAEFEARLALYKEGKRPILETINVDFDTFFEDLKRDIERILLSSLNVYIDPDTVININDNNLQEEPPID